MTADNREIQVLTDREHVLLRPNTYLGSVVPLEKEEWILHDDGTLKREKVTYPEALLKCANEIIDNSLDEYSKTNGKYSNKISIKIKNNRIIVEDNGRGLPVKQDEEGNWMPVTAFTQLRAGSNFSDDNRTSIGTNGVGSSATNVFSKKFEVNTCDGKKRLKLVCKDNLESTKFEILDTNLENTGTKVDFLLDFERFGVDGINDTIISLLKTRLRMLSWFYPKCNISFNGEKLNIRARELSTMFPSPNEFLVGDDVYINVYASEEPEVLTYVNGLSLRRGGNHVDYIAAHIINNVREKLIRKYKSIKPADIRNRLGFVVFLNKFPNCQFDSQTKELLSNNDKEIRAFLKDIDLAKLSRKLLYNKDIIDNITEMFKLKEELAEKKAVQKLNTKKRDVDSDKYFPPVGKKEYLMLTEGYSAFSGLSAILGRKGIAYYALRGKVLNVQGLSVKKMLENKEISDLVNILNLDLSTNNSEMSFEKIVVASDADADGSHICSLLINLFNRLSPDAFNEGKFCRLKTPVIIGKKKGKVVSYYYSLGEFSKIKADSSITYKYVKGLGSWNKEELQQVIELEGGLDNILIPFTLDESGSQAIIDWMGDNSDVRKQKLRGKEFHIDSI